MKPGEFAEWTKLAKEKRSKLKNTATLAARGGATGAGVGGVLGYMMKGRSTLSSTSKYKNTTPSTGFLDILLEPERINRGRGGVDPEAMKAIRSASRKFKLKKIIKASGKGALKGAGIGIAYGTLLGLLGT